MMPSLTNQKTTLSLMLLVLWTSNAFAMSPPTAPSHVTIVSDSDNIGVQWESPTNTYGNLRKYIVSWAILPNITEVHAVVDGDVTMAILSVMNYPGRMFRIRIRAENDAGLGPYSDVQYIRISCGRHYDVYPGSSVTITSPGYEKNVRIQPGLLCKWTFQPLDKYSINVNIKELDLVPPTNGVTAQPNVTRNCTHAYLSMCGEPKMCDMTSSESVVKCSDKITTIILHTGIQAGGRGFKAVVTSSPILPGPPTRVTLRSFDHAVTMAWQKPREDTLPITAYRVRYGQWGAGRSFVVTLGSGMRQFTVNTDVYEGKMMHFNISAVIGEDEGQMSRTAYIRAPCVRRHTLSPATSINITSPLYPHHYPRNIVCVWYITSSRPEVTFSITYLDFRLEETSFCSSDFVLLSYRSTLQPECSRKSLFKTETTKASNFTVRFVTDGVNEFAGFLIRITAYDTTSSTVTTVAPTPSKPAQHDGSMHGTTPASPTGTSIPISTSLGHVTHQRTSAVATTTSTALPLVSLLNHVTTTSTNRVDQSTTTTLKESVGSTSQKETVTSVGSTTTLPTINYNPGQFTSASTNGKSASRTFTPSHGAPANGANTPRTQTILGSQFTSTSTNDNSGSRTPTPANDNGANTPKTHTILGILRTKERVYQDMKTLLHTYHKITSKAYVAPTSKGPLDKITSKALVESTSLAMLDRITSKALVESTSATTLDNITWNVLVESTPPSTLGKITSNVFVESTPPSTLDKITSNALVTSTFAATLLTDGTSRSTRQNTTYTSSRQYFMTNSTVRATTDTSTKSDKLVWALVVGGFVAMVMAALAMCCCHWRRRHRSVKVNVERRSSTPIQLHDIVPHCTQIGNSGHARNALTGNDVTKSSFVRRKRLDPIKEAEEPPQDVQHDKNGMQRLERRYSFPQCFSGRKRKVHIEIQRTLASFGFIDDQEALEAKLRRKRTRLRQTNSFWL